MYVYFSVYFKYQSCLTKLTIKLSFLQNTSQQSKQTLVIYTEFLTCTVQQKTICLPLTKTVHYLKTHHDTVINTNIVTINK